MRKSLTIGLLAFALSYILLALLAAWWLPDTGWLASDWVSDLVVSALVAACAVACGLAVGRLTLGAMAICSLALQVAVAGTTLGLMVALSSRGTGTIVWPSQLGAVLAPHRVGLAANFVAGVVWPIAWLLVVRRLAPQRVSFAGS